MSRSWVARTSQRLLSATVLCPLTRSHVTVCGSIASSNATPQVLVLDRLLAALPAVALPLGKPSLCERARQVGRIRVDRERRRAAKCQQPFQGCSQFHAVVRRHILAAVAFELLRHSAVSAPGDEDESPTAPARIP